MATTKKKAPLKKPTKKKDIPKCQPNDKVKPQGKFESDEILQPSEKCNEVLQNTTKERKPTANQIAYQALRTAGLNHYRATKELGLSSGYGYGDKGVSKKNYGEAIAKLMPTSLKVIKSLSKGEPVGEMADIKGSDVIAANKMIWDRVAPVTSEAPVVQHQSFTQVNFNIIPTTQSSINNPSIDVSILPVNDSK